MANLTRSRALVELDPCSPFFVRPADSQMAVLVTPGLVEGNYSAWSRMFLVALSIRNKIGFVDGSIVRPAEGDPLFVAWKRCDDLVRTWIYKSVSVSIATTIFFLKTAKEIWEELNERFAEPNDSRICQLQMQFHNLKQVGSFCPFPCPPPSLSTMRPKIVIFGDSITEASFCGGGWGASLAHHFSRSADVVLRGYDGYNTRWALKVMDRVFPLDRDGVEGALMAVTIFFGANDACLPDPMLGFLHVPLEEYKQNLCAIVSLLQKRWPMVKIILITPPPIDEETRLRHPYFENSDGLPERTNEAAGAYAKACMDVASECGLSCINLWAKMQLIPDWKNSCLSDGLHLTETGNRIVFEEVIVKLKENGLTAEHMPVELPRIGDIDPINPLESFKRRI
ncbi:hypothetical protein MLD38_012176 [Melastoma candidum]|uniref:Uncharacterized protein n=1 Tax=Melastoma candidum TaxID=119954 RepID=A0ACB9R6T6_9MYRT|nr:hypothetical protein MLD38_012176 [Melastoma candidum]